MSRITTIIPSTLASLLLFGAGAVQAEWTLDNDHSAFYYVTSKAGAVTELNSFRQLSGSIDNGGMATLELDLGSVNTAIESRDERMGQMVFDLENFPQARVELQVDPEELEQMQAGQSRQDSYEAMLTINETTESIPAQVAVTRLQNGGLQIHNVQPIILNAALYGLSEGVEKLREVAGLPSINNNVVVNFTLRYNQDS